MGIVDLWDNTFNHSLDLNDVYSALGNPDIQVKQFVYPI